MTDHSSTEGSRDILAEAVEALTGSPPVLVDARRFMTGGDGQARTVEGRLQLSLPGADRAVWPSAVLIFEIPPHRRRHLVAFQRRLRELGARSLGLDDQAWKVATEKDLMVERFARDGIPQMDTLTLSGASQQECVDAFERLGRDVWARPVVGMGGRDVFHITTHEQLHEAARFYQDAGQGWLIARDAGNFTPAGQRTQFRVLVLHGQVLQAHERLQPDPDAPCNIAQGATTTAVLAPNELPAGLGELAVRATKSLGLPFGGVDLAPQNGGVVFEVNVHPAFNPVHPVESIAIPYVQAHLDLL
ncbi:ATP-grasp domain-containing protein [Streptomyces lavendofoliae]|nr:alpha-L-glutamate ligase [Streptomyces lavendofoliae]